MDIRDETDGAGTREAILDSAERLVQRRGFNGFSYADVAAELGITKAALHYHFSGKADLGDALVARYSTRFSLSLAEIEVADGTAAQRLRAYADLYLGVLRGERMCLCGMLAAEHETLPDSMRQRVIAFLDDNVAWLSRLLEVGRIDSSLRFAGHPEDVAQLVLGTLEGAMLVARPYSDTARFEAVVSRLLDEIGDPPASSGRH